MRTLILVIIAAVQSTALASTPDQLWQHWPEERFVHTPAPCLRPAELAAELQRLAALHAGSIEVVEAGRSVQNRPIHLVSLGSGSRTVLLWSQMHGDEPSATPALLDIAHFLLSHADESEATSVLEQLRLLLIPMLNPDGAEVYERRNAQGIDINRDALSLATPEGRLLKRVRDEHQPMLGFNLHDMRRRPVVGESGVPATIALLAVAGDAAGTVTPGRLRAMRACAAIVEALSPFVPGGIARFNEDWSPRAFGDNLTAWGTPVVLIESGNPPPGVSFEDLTRLNVVAILTVLQELAHDDLHGYDPERYTDLERTQRDGWADVVVRGGSILQPCLGPPYQADLAFNRELSDRQITGCAADSIGRSRIVELGDVSQLGAGRVVDATGSLLVAPFVAGVEGWRARRWLSSAVLADVARLGVGTLRWEVPRRKLAAAKTLAAELAGQGQARLEVVPAPARMPWLVLTGPPAQPASDSLRDVVVALAGTTQNAENAGPDLLELLSDCARAPSAEATPGRGQPASLLVLSLPPDGHNSPENAVISFVLIDGIEVRGDSK